jgi:hypothetical protein
MNLCIHGLNIAQRDILTSKALEYKTVHLTTFPVLSNHTISPLNPLFPNMSDLSIELTAPNGRKYTQPLGLFINNEWVKSSDGTKIESINPS